MKKGKILLTLSLLLSALVVKSDYETIKVNVLENSNVLIQKYAYNNGDIPAILNLESNNPPSDNFNVGFMPTKSIKENVELGISEQNVNVLVVPIEFSDVKHDETTQSKEVIYDTLF